MDPYINNQAASGNKPEFTGKKLVLLHPDASFKDIDNEAAGASLRLAPSGDYKSKEGDYAKAFDEGDGIVFEKFNVAVVNADHDDQVNNLMAARQSFQYTEPERFVYALDAPSQSNFGMLLWNFICQIFGIKRPEKAPKDPKEIVPPAFENDAAAYWAIHALGALQSQNKGKGVHVAILDTGMNLEHPDFQNREVIAQSFITGEAVDDFNGHGTHCAGIAAGGISSATGIRYGAASEAVLYAGKVLSNKGVGSDSGILAGMEWAVNNGCKVISMSLGASVGENARYSNIYNDLAKKSMDLGTLIIAAAGNDSERSHDTIKPVNHPGNCPNIMAVGALDKNSAIANFSCGGLNPDGGSVDIAGPGVAIYSSWKKPQEYAVISGTSMATPYVAGVAAMLFEAFPEASARDIWEKLTGGARNVGLPARDAGSGLVQAPQ
jgi:subtilisin family serine protease